MFTYVKSSGEFYAPHRSVQPIASGCAPQSFNTYGFDIFTGLFRALHPETMGERGSKGAHGGPGQQKEEESPIHTISFPAVFYLQVYQNHLI